MKRKEFENLFATFNENGKQIWVITRVKELPKPIVNMALNLAALDFIKFININDEALATSNENYPKRPKVPITNMNHETAIGVQILYSPVHKYINFYDINSPIKGNGNKMVDAILRALPKDWHPSVVMDWSNGFWEKMKEKYANIEWIM
ncbi:hypothetical protein [Prolixibacter sp. NT017]|uniref:hypothetical protein n=1 Tax=Prolixibacter sp. NT017 TaxID=2652390 RepID=UPI00128433E8|nr:hypothetical protein [Prolixibacter sp. NT017]GET24392.1 hypothetical protein NT017_07210 [Prolixibacter sp. NT017]